MVPRVVEKVCWYGIVGLTHFVVVPAVMSYAAIKGIIIGMRGIKIDPD
jgi:hypothetical protein